METALANAMRRRDELRAELKEIESFITLYNRFADNTSDSDVSPAIVTRRQVGTRPGMRRNIPTHEIAERVVDILTREKRPMARGEIVAALEAGGVQLNTEDKARYIGTILWRDKERFENLEGAGYWLRGVSTIHENGEKKLVRSER